MGSLIAWAVLRIDIKFGVRKKCGKRKVYSLLPIEMHQVISRLVRRMLHEYHRFA